ncbi:hypothetical protein LTR85_000021 [Meristemomyces frigidus]|nr:hypothetical protein LTR85_000021 [Meristemomyces frigidus]
MKFRTSFQISREPREDAATPPNMSSMPFKMASLRHKKSKAIFNDYELEKECVGAQQAAKRPDTAQQQQRQQEDEQRRREQQQQERQQGGVRKAFSRKRAMQDFFRSTQANLKTTGATIKASSAKLPHRMTVRKARVTKQPPSKRNSSQMHSLDIDSDVLDKLMGPAKPVSSGRIQSPSFLVKQKLRASSRAAASSPRITLSSTSARSQAEWDRKLLSVEELQDMFAGAPYFNVENLGNGQYRPQVIFRGGDVEASARYGRDYSSLGHSSFEASTLGLHRTRQTAGGRAPAPGGCEGDLPNKTSNTLLEVPSMLSANGLDPGTIGYEHFLQLPIADSAILPDEPKFFDKRKLLYSEPERVGLRELNMDGIIDRLAELGELYAASKDGSSEQQPWSDEKREEMGEDLFAKLLDPELGTTGAGTGSVTLKTQVTALQKVLDETEIWHDFTQVEWRIRVGQLLWTSHEDEELQLDEHRQPSERDVLLLQVMLAAELLVRLNTLKGTTATSAAEDQSGEPTAQPSRKIQWDLLLAQTFLENLTISAKFRDGSSKATNRSSLFSAISFLTAKETPEDSDQAAEPLLFPKNEEKQLAGLLYFAEAIGWPHAEDVQSELEVKLTAPARPKQTRPASSLRPISGVSVYATPLSSPAFAPPSMYAPSVRANRSSGYFGGFGAQQQPQKSGRPGLSRVTTANSMQLLAASSASCDGPNAFEVGGWLSRSWLTGLVLPGEPASHFLISTLLENSPQAIEALGDAANLYGGFVYAGCSFWSKSCVVGRVLAATRGAQECMGWVSAPGIPEGQAGDGWVDVEVENAPTASPSGVGPDARIKSDGVVAKDSDPLHGTSVTSAQAGDFTIPADGPPVMGNEVKSHGAYFTPSQTSHELAKTHDNTAKGDRDARSTKTAHMTFSSPLNLKLAKLDVPLTYDVHFIASYPCHPSSPQRSPTSNSSPSPFDMNNPASPPASTEADDFLDAKSPVRPADSARASDANSGVTLNLKDIEKELPPPPAHPLHIDYHFDVVPVATLLSAPPERGRARALSSPEDRKVIVGATVATAEEVIVLDCRGTADLELLARAWCAKVGENALVGKTGRTCLACCVREARALGLGVVIRT